MTAMKLADQTIMAYEINADDSFRCTGVGIRSPQIPFTQKRRVMNEFIAFLVTHGTIHLTDELPTGEEDVAVKPGEIHILAPGLYQRSTRPFAPGTRFLWFHFTVPTPAGPVLLTGQQTLDTLSTHHHDAAAGRRSWIIPRHMKLNRSYDILRNCHQELLGVVRLWGTADPSCHTIARYMTHTLQREFSKQCLSETALPGQADAEFHIQRARNYIRLHYDKGISLADVAETVHITPAHLSRIFRQKTGQTVVENILHVRIAAAKELMVTSHCSTKEAAYLCGFRSASYFCRVFKKLEGISPMDYCAATQTGGDEYCWRSYSMMQINGS